MVADAAIWNNGAGGCEVTGIELFACIKLPVAVPVNPCLKYGRSAGSIVCSNPYARLSAGYHRSKSDTVFVVAILASTHSGSAGGEVVAAGHGAGHSFRLAVGLNIHTRAEIQIRRNNVYRTLSSDGGSIRVGKVAIIKSYIAKVECEIVLSVRKIRVVGHVSGTVLIEGQRDRVRNCHRYARGIIGIRYRVAYIYQCWYGSAGT